jgi:hypothetical protein
MLRIRRRIELLDEAFLPVEPGPPHIINLRYVDSQMKVVGTHRIEIPSVPPAPRNRVWRTAQRSSPAWRRS